MSDKGKVLNRLKRAIIDHDEEKAVTASKKAIESGIDAYEAMKGCNEGLKVLGQKYEKGDVFVPEILVSARTMKAAVEELKPYLKEEQGEKGVGKIVLGVVEGDIHDIGKNLVKLMLEASGYEVIDLGKDVEDREFIEALKKDRVDLVGLSALIASSMQRMESLVAKIHEECPEVDVIIGGGPVNEQYADEIGADGYADDAAAAVRLVNSLIENN